MRLFQRALFSLTAGILSLALGSFAQAGDWPTGTFVYEIKRRDKPIGAYLVMVKDNGGSVTALAEEWIRDISYCHLARRTEVWTDGKLISYDSLTGGRCGTLARIFRSQSCQWRKDGSPLQVTARLEGDVLRISRPSGTLEAPPSLIPFNPLNPLLQAFEKEVEILTSREGLIEKAWITFIGEEETELGDGTVRKTLRYIYRDEQWIKELWYVEGGICLRMVIPEDVTVTLVPGADPADYAPPEDVAEQCRTFPE